MERLHISYMLRLLAAVFVIFYAGAGIAGPQQAELQVAEAGLDGLCRLWVRLANRGPGEIPRTQLGNIQLRVTVGKQAPQSIPLGRLDHQGVLCRAGGQLKADTDIEMTETAAVTVALDAGKAIAGVSVKTNTLQTKLAPRCETARTGKADKGAAAEVAIEEVLAPKGEVVVILKREGAAKLDLAQAGRLHLQVDTEGKPRSWPLTQVDPGLKGLNGPKGQAAFSTGIELKVRLPVRAQLLGGGSPKPLVVMLGPAAAEKTEATKTMKPQTHLKLQEAIVPPDPRKIPLCLDDSGGIRITSPTRGQRFQPGDSMTIEATFLSDTAHGMVSFQIWKAGANQPLATIAFGFDPTPENMICQRVWGLPLGGLPSGSDYFIVADHRDGGLWGVSDVFTIGNSDGEGLIEVSRPRAGEGVTPGFTMHVDYRFTRRVEEGLVHIELYALDSEGRYGRPVLTRTQHHRPPSGPPGGVAPEPIHTIEWPIPEDTAIGRYFVLVTHPEAWGRSRNFNILSELTGYPIDDYAVLDIFMDGDEVKARIRASGGTIADYVQLSVNGLITRPLISPGDSDVIIRDYSNQTLGLCGQFFDVTIDPDGRITETNEGNNSLRKFIPWHGTNGRVWLPDHPSGTNLVRIACYRPDIYTPTVIVAVQNCGPEPISIGYGSIEVRQSGRRPRTGNQLGYEDFDVVVPHRTFISNCDDMGERRVEGEIPSGECGLIRIGIEDLSAVDSTLTYTFRNEFTAWPGLTNPYTVEVDYGQWVYEDNSLTERTCRYSN